jgi:hypothetical protein
MRCEIKISLKFSANDRLMPERGSSTQGAGWLGGSPKPRRLGPSLRMKIATSRAGKTGLQLSQVFEVTNRIPSRYSFHLSI